MLSAAQALLPLVGTAQPIQPLLWLLSVAQPPVSCLRLCPMQHRVSIQLRGIASVRQRCTICCCLNWHLILAISLVLTSLSLILRLICPCDNHTVASLAIGLTWLLLTLLCGSGLSCLLFCLELVSRRSRGLGITYQLLSAGLELIALNCSGGGSTSIGAASYTPHSMAGGLLLLFLNSLHLLLLLIQLLLFSLQQVLKRLLRLLRRLHLQPMHLTFDNRQGSLHCLKWCFLLLDA